MSCGKKRLVKNWDKPKIIPRVKPSRYEQNEASVKVHWRKVMRDLELSYQDDQFWDSQCDTVRELLGPKIFRRVAKIFNLPLEATTYAPKSETSSIEDSEKYYALSEPVHDTKGASRSHYSIVGEEEENSDENAEEEESELWSGSTVSVETKKSSRYVSSKSKVGISTSKLMSRTFSKYFSRTGMHQMSKSTMMSEAKESSDATAHSQDDLDVHGSQDHIKRSKFGPRRLPNPHFDMLYCNESETDMIKWKSKYKVKMFEISASDEMSKKAEIITKQISKDFYDWWVGLGNLEFKSEIKRPEDIETLFQVWFDEHASRGLMLHPKILPCVLTSIAEHAGAPESACPYVLKKQIEWDIEAESTPAHTMAFNTCLPHKMKHIPPDNNTKEMWDCVKIPEDLRTMSYVFDDINHLTSTKAFQKWLEMRPHLTMPECFVVPDAGGDKKVPFMVPSDFVVKDKDAGSSTQELALPVSQFSLELKEVLSKLMNH